MKHSAKSLVRALAVLLVLPFIIVDAVGRPFWGDGIFAACSQLLSLIPGKLGSYLRVAFYRFAMESCSANCFIGFATIFSQRSTKIGSGVYIGPQCNIGSCQVGKDTLIASGVHIMSGTEQHFFSDSKVPIREQGGHYKMIALGQDCWIGNAALIMANVGNGSIIGAGSVVPNDIPLQSIAVGNPAQVIRSREASGSTSAP